MQPFSTQSPTLKRGFVKSAILVGFMTLLSRITGLFQSRMLAAYLGVGMASDAFMVAFRIPNLLRRFTAEGTMTSAFLPTVSEVESSRGDAAARLAVARFIGSLGTLLLLGCAVMMLLMGLLVGIQQLGRFPGDGWTEQALCLGRVLIHRAPMPAEIALTTSLARLMFPYLVLVSLTAGLSAILNLKGRFGLPASVSTFWNLAFLTTGYVALHFGPPSWREPVQATFVFSVAVLVGGILQLLVLWPSFRSLGYGVHFGLHLQDPDVRRVLRRMLPGILGTGINPINATISMCLASQLAVGAQVVLLNANMMGEMVLGLFSTSMATVSLPAMSRQVDEGDLQGLRQSLSTALRSTALMAIPSSIGLAVLAQPIIAMIFQAGRFGADAVHWTATTLAFQTVGLLFIATSRILAQCLYALKDYKTPARGAMVALVANVILSFALMRPLGTGGMALANGLASLIGTIPLLVSLRRHLPRLPYRQVLRGWLAMGAAALVMGAVAWLGARVFALQTFHGTRGTALRLFPVIAVSAGIYFLILMTMRIPEAKRAASILKQRLKRA